MRQRGRPTLSDVARLAGTSVTTASYILNSRTEEMRISADAARRVHKAASDLSYRPNRSARNLRLRSTATIGVISDHVASGAFASRMLSGAATAARRAGHLLVIGETEGDAETERLLIEEMLERQVEGILYATVSTSTVTVPEALHSQPAVLLNCVDEDGRLPATVPDEVEGGRTAVTALGGSGDTGAVYVVGEESTRETIAGSLRMRGIVKRLAETGGSLAGVVPCAWAVVPAYQAVTGLLRQGAVPDALICLNDRVAMGAYEALREHRLRIPQDVAVVGFDGSDLAGWLRPTLSSVQIPYGDLGAVAVTALLDGSRELQRLPMPLLGGESTRFAVAERLG